MMIDRKTVLVCAGLIALMLVAAVARAIFLDDWTSPASQALLWVLILLPASPATLVVTLYANGRRAIAAEATVQPWCASGKRLAIGLCACTLLVQGQQILRSLGLQVPVSAGQAIAIAAVIIGLLSMNEIPKLPWFERGFGAGGELGPIYGRRYLRAYGRIWVMGFVAMMACFLVLPAEAWGYIPAAALLPAVCVMVVQRYYRRRLSRDQSTAANP
jgi:hypothetical protein